MRDATAIYVFSVLYGFFSGGLISLQSACVAQITADMNMIGIKIGLMMAVCSFGYVIVFLSFLGLEHCLSLVSRVLVGCPIGGALIASSSGSFGAFINFTGVILLFSALLVLFARLAVDRRVLRLV